MLTKKRLMAWFMALGITLGVGALSACNDDLIGTPAEPTILYELTQDKTAVEVVGYDGSIVTANIAENYQGFRVVRIRI